MTSGAEDEMIVDASGLAVFSHARLVGVTGNLR